MGPTEGVRTGLVTSTVHEVLAGTGTKPDIPAKSWKEKSDIVACNVPLPVITVESPTAAPPQEDPTTTADPEVIVKPGSLSSMVWLAPAPSGEAVVKVNRICV